MTERLNLSMMAKLFQSQQELNNRMQASDHAGEHISTLGVQIGEGFWLVEMSDISEVMPLPHITTVPLTKPWFCGVANVRGNLYSVVDLAAFMGQPKVLRDGQSRVLLAAQKFALNSGLLVNRVIGLRDTHAWRRSEVDGMIQYEDKELHTWRQLDVAKLLEQPEFLHVES